MMKQQKLVGTPQNTKEWKLEKKTKHKIPYFGPTFVYVKITKFSSFVFILYSLNVTENNKQNNKKTNFIMKFIIVVAIIVVIAVFIFRFVEDNDHYYDS